MDDTTTTSKAERVSDAAVQAKTGKTWAEWFAVLDAAGAAHMSHKAIVAHLAAHHTLEPWWQQNVTVMYERERGLRDKHQMVDGYQISVSKTIGVSVAALYHACADDALRQTWLPAAVPLR